MKNKEKVEVEKSSNTGLILLIICGLLAVALIVGCVFFPDEIFGIFMK